MAVVTRAKRKLTAADVNNAMRHYGKLFGKDPVQFPATAPRKQAAGRTARQTPLEHDEQVRYVAWFRRTYPGVLIFAIPNGGARDEITGAKLKQEGVVPDVPDLFAPKAKLFVEMKRIDGRIRPTQRDMADYLKGCGYSHIFGMGAEDAMSKTMQILPPPQ